MLQRGGDAVPKMTRNSGDLNQGKDVVAAPKASGGLREQNKLSKLRNIKLAAKELFCEKSFDDATTREIAIRAGVGMGTLFLYAENKRDLLFLISNDDLHQITRQTEQATSRSGTCFDNFIFAFKQHYQYFGQHPELSRSMLREMTFYDSGKLALEFQAIRSRMLKRLATFAEMGQANGELRADTDPGLIAWVVFSIYQVELRRWLLSPKPDVAAGVRKLKQSLALFFEGVNRK